MFDLLLLIFSQLKRVLVVERKEPSLYLIMFSRAPRMELSLYLDSATGSSIMSVIDGVSGGSLGASSQAI